MDEWQTMPNLNSVRHFHSSCAVGNSVFVFWGCRSTDEPSVMRDVNDSIEQLDLMSSSWRLIKVTRPVNLGADLKLCALNNQEAFVVDDSNTIWIFDIILHTYTKVNLENDN